MKHKLIILLFCITAITFAVQAQDKTTVKPVSEPTPATVAPAKSVTEKLTAKDYEDLLGKLNKGDTAIDFVRLRLAYTETKNYSPYGGGEERGAMYQALQKKDFKNALKLAETILKTNFVDVAAQFVAAKANTELGKTKDAEFHTKVFQGLIDAINANDGKTAKTAIISIGISEQYFVMSYFGFPRGAKSLVRDDNSTFDVHDVTNPETKENRKFYFNIDKVFGRL